jgi:quercetin dioxygenase-like cupin family protein
MHLNADFTVRVLVHGADLPWTASPLAGVDRRMLSRIGDEIALATSLVRYAPGSHFSAHTHARGEEFIVLDGVFQDEHGDYPAGSYVRNPPGSHHTPASAPGTTIFVKLRHFHADDTAVVRHRISATGNDTLHDDAHETVHTLRLENEQHWQADVPYGCELLVLTGTLTEGSDHLKPWSWLRLPANAHLAIKATSDHTVVWLKRYKTPPISSNATATAA